MSKVDMQRSCPDDTSADAPAIRNVSDTALWVAVYRAIESERPDALFRDPHARRLAGERGQAIVESLPFGEAMGWSIVVRTAVMDEVILRCVERGARTVLNLGAGLDTRAFRLPLPSTLRWLDVDLPAVTAYRRQRLGTALAVCEHAHVEADLLDPDERRRVIRDAGRHGPVLVITEGLLVYLSADEVDDLASHLQGEANVRWWLTDLITPPLQHTMGMVWSRHLDQADATFRFAPADSQAYFGKLDWRQTEFHSTWSDSIRLGRAAPHSMLWQSLLRWSAPAARVSVERMSGVALLEPAS